MCANESISRRTAKNACLQSCCSADLGNSSAVLAAMRSCSPDLFGPRGAEASTAYGANKARRKSRDGPMVWVWMWLSIKDAKKKKKGVMVERKREGREVRKGRSCHCQSEDGKAGLESQLGGEGGFKPIHAPLLPPALALLSPFVRELRSSPGMSAGGSLFL